ncbi:MAG: sulfate adenylyltransferase subunit CysN [Gemmatimonadota bacterium]|nr:sulfate adenylyltransferase subunit CysN [Gemmatimonadota bacterium]
MTDIQTFLQQNEEKELLRFSTAGSVDDGKSTLIGRLLADSKNIYEDQLEALKKLARKDEAPDLALLLDGLKAEREQGITIDVAYRYFSTPQRKFIIADTPGHEQYTRNMATGASTANLSIILIDARNGVITQSKRHAFIASLLGIDHLLVAVNKMDLVDYKEAIFDEVRKGFLEFAAKLNVSDIRLVPISALNGDNVVERKDRMPWYHGQTVLEILEEVQFLSDRNLVDFRFPVQYVIRPNQDFRSYAGTVLSGMVRPGDEVLVLPKQIRSRVKTVVSFDGDLDSAFPPMSVSLQLEDEVDISRGDMIVHPKNLTHVEQRFEAMLIWMDEKPMDPSRYYLIKHTTQSSRVSIDHIDYKVDVNTLRRNMASYLELNEIGRVALTSNRPLFFDPYRKNHLTGSFILVDYLSNNTVAGGMIIDRLPEGRVPKDLDSTSESEAITARQPSRVSAKARAAHYGQKPCTIWLTGLVGSGKSEIAYALEHTLHELKYSAVVLDSATVRGGLNRDLGFSAADQVENLRRVAECARILNDSGMIAISAFLSPSKQARQQTAELIGSDRYIEVYLDASLAWCKEQDHTGCYEQSEKGLLKNLAGVDYPYEIPQDPALTIPRESESEAQSVDDIMTLLKDRGFLLKE